MSVNELERLERLDAVEAAEQAARWARRADGFAARVTELDARLARLTAERDRALGQAVDCVRQATMLRLAARRVQLREEGKP